MGFLDNSTNNVIIDAVLTNEGRKFLSQNNGSFSISKFAMGDDEVDYGIIEKYGRQVGTEKIIKNTPVFEAQTHEFLALKHKLISLSNATLIRLPSLDLTLESNATFLSMTIASDTTANKKTISISQTIQNQAAIEDELVDGLYRIEMNNRFLFIPGQSPQVNPDNMAEYLINSDGLTTSKGGSKLTFQVQTRPINQFSLFSTFADASIIKTYVIVEGWYSGAEKIVEVQIQNTAS